MPTCYIYVCIERVKSMQTFVSVKALKVFHLQTITFRCFKCFTCYYVNSLKLSDNNIFCLSAVPQDDKSTAFRQVVYCLLLSMHMRCWYLCICVAFLQTRMRFPYFVCVIIESSGNTVHLLLRNAISTQFP